ncbi:MAG: UPF0280 family protein [Rhodoferax sp.]
MNAQRALLPGNRRHFSHGPIDLVIGAEGDERVVAIAHEAAWQRFTGVLQELAAELQQLRQPVHKRCALRGPIARRMWQACHPYCADYITPMAAVAGAVAQEIILAYQRVGVSRAWVNNGGDIALYLPPGASVRVGLFADLARVEDVLQRGTLRLDGDFVVSSELPVRGIATSGWRGRSFSLGIADSVTVLAASAAQADAAATVIANAVTVIDPRIVRRRACDLRDDTDLADLQVTVDVPALDGAAVQTALAAGLACALELRAEGLIWHAVLVCQKQSCSTGQGVLHELPPGGSGDTASSHSTVAWHLLSHQQSSRETVARTTIR